MFNVIPFRAARNLMNTSMDDMLSDRFFRNFFDMSDMVGTAGFRVDVKEQPDAYVLEAELPGVKQDDITLTAEDGVLTIAMECAYAPYNWTQNDDANGAVEIRGSSDYAYGYDVMMAKKIADALGQNVQIVKLDWDSLIPAVMSGDVDCVIAGQSITAERAAQVDFSDPYYYASIVTLTKKDSAYANAASVADLAGATATSQLGTIWYDTCLPQIENANILPAQETAPAMLVALNSGACDIVVTDHPTGQAALTAYPDLVMLDFGGGDGDFQVSDEDINIGISMKKGNTALKDRRLQHHDGRSHQRTAPERVILPACPCRFARQGPWC